jgi:hypothetical protein
LNFTLKELPRILVYYAGRPGRLIERRRIRRGKVDSANAKGLLALKNRHSAKRCFVIGNGPSLSVADLDRLKGEITFAANKIYLAFEQTDWRPTYYLVEDSMVVRQNFERINRLDGMTKLFPYRLKRWAPTFDNALYFNLRFKRYYLGRPRFGVDALDALYWGSTIVYTCIQMACYMGIREIYLIGIDFNFSVPSQTTSKNKAVLISHGEKNHFHPDYRPPGEKWYQPNLHHQRQAFLSADNAVKAMGGHIFNATRGGKLDIFKRVDFDTLLSD